MDSDKLQPAIKIISTGSQGNAVVINKNILIDCGVPFKKLKDVYKDLKLVFLTHKHSDHFNPCTIRAIHKNRPSLRFCCCEWMIEPLIKAGVSKKNIDVFELNKQYFYGGLVLLEPVPLVHDVPNCGWKLEIVLKAFPIEEAQYSKVFYATDTANLDGIEAPGYDWYLVEGNYSEADIERRIAEKEAAGEFCYEARAREVHLSKEQAVEWLAENMGPDSHYMLIHQHREKIKEVNK